MSRAKQAAKKKRLSKAGPVLGAAGLSLALASGASTASSLQVDDMLTRKTAVSRQITLREEEVSDVSLATFYVFDKEAAGAFRPGMRLTRGAAGCWTGTYYTSDPPPPIRPAHKYYAPKHVPKK